MKLVAQLLPLPMPVPQTDISNGWLNFFPLSP